MDTTDALEDFLPMPQLFRWWVLSQCGVWCGTGANNQRAALTTIKRKKLDATFIWLVVVAAHSLDSPC